MKPFTLRYYPYNNDNNIDFNNYVDTFIYFLYIENYIITDLVHEFDPIYPENFKDYLNRMKSLIQEKFDNVDINDIYFYSFNDEVYRCDISPYISWFSIKIIQIEDRLYYMDKLSVLLYDENGKRYYKNTLDNTKHCVPPNFNNIEDMNLFEKILRNNNFDTEKCIGVMQYLLNGKYFIRI